MVGKSQQSIQFHYLTSPFYLPNRLRIKQFISRIFQKEKFPLNHINFIFCDDVYLQSLNKKYLKHKTLTDIITFPFHAKGSPILADIYISIDRIRDNARTYNVPFSKEITRVMFHGVLHLCGHNDKTQKQTHQMRKMENFYMSDYFVSRGTSL